MARPTKYKASYVPLVLWMSRAGQTDEEMAKELWIHRGTLYAWKKQHKEFSDAIKEGKKEADDKVEQALFRRAVGYEYEEIKTVEEIKARDCTNRTPKKRRGGGYKCDT